jgi:hypothetical protein
MINRWSIFRKSGYRFSVENATKYGSRCTFRKVRRRGFGSINKRVGTGGIMRCLAVTAIASAAFLGVSPVPAVAAELSPALKELYASVSIYPPTAERFTVCYGFVCRRREVLDFTSADRKALTDLLAKGKASPDAERKAVQQAVIWFDRRMGPIIGTSKRIARADFRYFDDKHNYDCYDTTRNTTSLLLVLQAWGLLRHHVVGEPRFRGKFFLGQTPHNTAVLTERAGGAEWVVDMWTRAYAELPDVMPVDQWLKED